MVVLMQLGLRKSRESGYFKNRKLDIYVSVIQPPRGVTGRMATLPSTKMTCISSFLFLGLSLESTYSVRSGRISICHGACRILQW